jgi:hypothetical protein
LRAKLLFIFKLRDFSTSWLLALDARSLQEVDWGHLVVVLIPSYHGR